MNTIRQFIQSNWYKARYRFSPALLSLAALLVLCHGVVSSQAAQNCKAQINPVTGAIEVSARNVDGNPGWSILPDEQKTPFADEARCYDGSTLSKCHLGPLATLAEKTPPPDCRLCIGDAGPDPDCCVDVQACTPGIRPGGASLSFSDPRIASAELTDCAWQACRDTPAFIGCPAGKIMVGIDLPELGAGANEDSLGCSGLQGVDNTRIRCCRIGLQ